MGKYANRVIKGQTCVWLQKWGWQPAKLGKDIQVGDILVYNWGYRHEVVSIDKETKSAITVSTKSLTRDFGEYGKIYSQRISKKAYKAVVIK